MLKLFTKVKTAAKKAAERCKLRKPRPREYTVGEEYKNINMINDRLFIETMVSYTMVLDNIAAMLEENAIVRELAFNPRTSAINSIRSASSSTAANSVNSVRPIPKTGISVSQAAKEKRIKNQIAKKKRAKERLDIIDGEFFDDEFLDGEFFDDDTTADEVSDVFVKDPDCRSIADNNSTASSTALPHISEDLDFDLIDLSDAESTRSYFSTPLETDSLVDDFDANNQPNMRKSLSSGLIDNKLAIAEAQAIKKNNALIRATVRNNANICIAT
ncbi:hypothetical protein H4R99_004783 [Coemansia sp. RSA 1722]|nr:hypothetical protein LPJ57_001934 [Coemansia sp. RSA 486]KAJ2230701.1 hypothetical protein IWW45_005707 [Coemansia sp. RSA 485]KAJ2596782.1 hypothetical protein H4R99_004783 [Coemansia sp. RSA 1722]KAJ2598738.1 hypothetical protein GGF39_002529 [Coemansia sp. RSA 1721]KAJ2637752.1 hypothetical protein GGF40_002137 [Coemansia sp. RSA 1286]